MASVASVIPTVQAVGLVSYNVGKLNKKRLSAKDILGLGVTNVVGTSLIRSSAGMVSGL